MGWGNYAHLVSFKKTKRIFFKIKIERKSEVGHVTIRVIADVLFFAFQKGEEIMKKYRWLIRNTYWRRRKFKLGGD